MLVAGPRGAGKSEFVKQLLSLKCFIMTNPPERIVWFYGRHQSNLFCSLAQEIPCIEFYEGLLTNIEVMFDRSKRNICIIDDLMQSASGNNLEKYRIFEVTLKPFIHKAFDQCGSLLRKIMLEGEIYHLFTQLPLTIEERNSLVMYSRSFLPVSSRVGVV